MACAGPSLVRLVRTGPISQDMNGRDARLLLDLGHLKRLRMLTLTHFISSLVADNCAPRERGGYGRVFSTVENGL